MKTIGVIVGSLRKDSFSKKVAENIAKKMEANYAVRYISINDLPLYNEDLEGDTPPSAWATFRSEIKDCDAFLFVTPEYNRSFPAALKNALDVGSRPYGSNLFDGKPAGLVSQSPGSLGGFGANHHLRQVLVFLNVYPLQQPEMYLSNVADIFDESGNIVERTDKYLAKFASELDTWIQKF